MCTIEWRRDLCPTTYTLYANLEAAQKAFEKLKSRCREQFKKDHVPVKLRLILETWETEEDEPCGAL